MAAGYSVNVSVPHQSGHATCWAAGVSAVLRAMNVAYTTPSGTTQTDLDEGSVIGIARDLGFEVDKKAQAVETVLGKFGVNCSLMSCDGTFAADALKDSIVMSLNGGIPVIVGVRASNASLVWKVDWGKYQAGEMFQMMHALICVNYDQQSTTFTFKDSARADDATIDVTLDELFRTGFVYMPVASLGSETRAKLEVLNNATSVQMIAHRLVIPMKTR